MTKFYVKITDEMPTVDDKALWFEINSKLQDSKEFFVLGRNEYNTMHDEFIQAKDNLTESSILADAMSEIMNDEDFKIELCHKSDVTDKLVNPEDNRNFFTWSSLLSRFNSIGNSISSLSNAIADKVSSEQLTSVVNSLTSSINGKANATHSHTGWTYKKLNDYSSIYYNDAIKMCYFRYYRGSYNFTKTDIFILHTGLIPSAYRPHGDIILPFYHYHLIGRIDYETGNFYIKSDTKTSYAINTSAMWSYK